MTLILNSDYVTSHNFFLESLQTRSGGYQHVNSSFVR